jgi:hypothetical protein
VLLLNKLQKDNYLTVSQVADFIGCKKEDIKKFVHEGKLTPLRAYPNDTRYILSMREVNRFSLLFLK